jgi:hypothetical protein
LRLSHVLNGGVSVRQCHLACSIIVLLLLFQAGPLIAQVTVLAAQTDGLVPHLVHSVVRPMNFGLLTLDVRLVAFLLVKHSYSASLRIVGLLLRIIALFRGPLE